MTETGQSRTKAVSLTVLTGCLGTGSRESTGRRRHTRATTRGPLENAQTLGEVLKDAQALGEVLNRAQGLGRILTDAQGKGVVAKQLRAVGKTLKQSNTTGDFHRAVPPLNSG